MTLDMSFNLAGLAPVVGLRIRETRTDKSMSQKDLVGERFSKSYISSIERGKITPSLKALEYIAKRLDVSVSFLLTGIHAAQTGFKPAIVETDEATQDIPARWDLFLTEARILLEQNQPEQARHLLYSKIRIRQLNVDYLKQYHFLIAQIGLELGAIDETLDELETARELAEKTGDIELLARCRRLLGTVYIGQGKSVQAIEQLRMALQAIEAGAVKDVHLRLSIYSQLGLLHRQLGDDNEATQMYKQALALAESSANPVKLAQLYWQLAANYRDSGNLTQAKTYATKSLALYESQSDVRLLNELRSGFGSLMLAARHFEEAEEQFLSVYRLSLDLKDTLACNTASMYLTELYLEQNNLEKAQFYGQRMESDLATLEPTMQGRVLSSRANLLAAQGQYDEAIKTFEQAIDLIVNTDLLSKAYFGYARALSAKGDSARAAEMFERAYRQLGRPSLM